ncbi:MAG TPA: hypothetical protein VLJ38_01370 [Polyangiaceae bacterium]|nr:hypothetical protein [Polyangiaceae bacterium]
MLELLTSEQFATWFATLEDGAAEDVATALEVIGELGPERAPPASRESLLWYEHASVAEFGLNGALPWDLEAWGAFRDYAQRVLAQLEAPRFAARLERLGTEQAACVLKTIRRIRRAVDPRLRWALELGGHPAAASAPVRPENACAKVRQLYFEALEAAGFAVKDVPAHSRALRELSRRSPAPAFRVLYGVDTERKTALVVLGEWLDRSYYGDSVRRAERLWSAFMNGERLALEPAALR